jgi:hypothetical protein
MLPGICNDKTEVSTPFSVARKMIPKRMPKLLQFKDNSLQHHNIGMLNPSAVQRLWCLFTSVKVKPFLSTNT